MVGWMTDRVRLKTGVFHFLPLPDSPSCHFPQDIMVRLFPPPYTLDMILSYVNRKPKTNSPSSRRYIHLPHNPRSSMNPLHPMSGKEADIHTVVSSLSTVSTPAAEVTIPTKHGAIRMAPSGRGITCRRIYPTPGCLCMGTTRT
jgi:hypothetical protein